MVGRFSKPTHAPSGGKPPKSTPFRVYFLNSTFSCFAFLDSAFAKLLAPSADVSKPNQQGPNPRSCKIHAKQPSTESFTGPEPRFSQKVIVALSGPFQRASNGQAPELAKLGYFCIKRPLYKEPRRARAQILPILAISVLSGPLQRASKGPGPGLAKFGFFCMKRPFTKSLAGPGPRLCQFWLFLY